MLKNVCYSFDDVITDIYSVDFLLDKKIYENISVYDVFFLPAVWQPHGQLWAIIEEAASLTQC